MNDQTWEVGSGIRVYLASIHAVPQEDWPTLFSQMPPARQARCARYRHLQDRQRCILAHALVQEALAELSGKAAGGIEICYPPKSKPYAPGGEGAFSLSHSGAYVLCAAGSIPVGADLQRQRPVSDALRRSMTRAGFPGGSEEEFFRWWVRQEAGGKLLGTGLTLSPLPPGLRFHSGEFYGEDGKYFYCIAEK